MITRTINKILKSLNNLPAEYKVALARILTGMIEGIDYLNKEKVDKEEGKELSTNDFTDELKTKLENLPSEFEQIQGDWNQNDSTKVDYIKNRTHYTEENPRYHKVWFTGIINNISINDYITIDEIIKAIQNGTIDLYNPIILLPYNVSIKVTRSSGKWRLYVDNKSTYLDDTPFISKIAHIENDEYILNSPIALNMLAYDVTQNYSDKSYGAVVHKIDEKYLPIENYPNVALWNSTTKEIQFKHGDTLLPQMTISGTNFIKDGMVDNVQIQNGNLVITFNTDSGKQPISIPLVDIFNPDNYYTKTQADAKFVEKVTGKQLSTEDYTTEEKTKLNNIENNAQANKIEKIKVNNVEQQIVDKEVNIILPDTNKFVKGEGITNIVKLYQSEYDALNPKSNDTFYVVKPDIYLPGDFSVSATKKVKFSKGNLQAVIGEGVTDYVAKASEWKFAEHQWDYIGNAPGNTNFAIDSVVDLFGWVGESAEYDSYGLCINTKSDNKYYGTIGDEKLKTDWGSIPDIINNYGEGWRTLTRDEWDYLISTRIVNRGRGSGKSYTVGQSVSGILGTVLYPDNYTGNTYTTGDDWSIFESVGCVFLPAAHDRSGMVISNSKGYASYTSSTSRNSSSYIDYLTFNTTYIGISSDYRNRGMAVRLVYDKQ